VVISHLKIEATIQHEQTITKMNLSLEIKL